MTTRPPTDAERALRGKQVRIIAADYPDNIGKVGTAEWSLEDHLTIMQRAFTQTVVTHGEGHHWIVRDAVGTGYYAADVEPVNIHDGCPSGPDCTTCPDHTCRLLNDKRSETSMPGPHTTTAAQRDQELQQRLVDQMTPRGKRALALERAKGIYPEANIYEHLEVADWLLREPDASKDVAVDSGPVLPDFTPEPFVIQSVQTTPVDPAKDYARSYDWMEEAGYQGRVHSMDGLDSEGEIAYIRVTPDEDSPKTIYLDRVQARQVIQTLERAIATA